MRFIDDTHNRLYTQILNKMKKQDCYHDQAAYLLALDRVCREHIEDIFDFEKDLIIREALHKGWQTGTSLKTTRLLFNLWNSCVYDGEMYKDKQGYETELPSRHYGVDEIFACGYAPYYWEAIKLRYPEYTEE